MAKHTITIVWGSDTDPDNADEVKERTTEYTFKSQEALDAFMLGIHDTIGWNGYEITACSDQRIELGEYSD
jgi:hypothetical protein